MLLEQSARYSDLLHGSKADVAAYSSTARMRGEPPMRRVLASLIATTGAALVAAGSIGPVYSVTGKPDRSHSIIGTSTTDSWYAAEPLGVAIATVVVSVLLVILNGRVLAGLLMAMGAQTLLFYGGYVGDAASDPALDLAWGAVFGVVGGGLITISGVVALLGRSSAKEPVVPGDAVATRLADRPPAGWYADPAGLGASRYWDGRTWTELTHGA
jgi:hypothetical protein